MDMREKRNEIEMNKKKRNIGRIFRNDPNISVC